jgi:proteic killer suppression protein
MGNCILNSKVCKKANNLITLIVRYMIVYFSSDELKMLYVTPLEELRGKRKIPTEVIKQYKKKVNLLIKMEKLEQLKFCNGLNFEFLKGERKGLCSLRLNDQYRLIITPENEKTIQIILINEISKHYE